MGSLPQPSSSAATAYWNTNVDPSQHTTECPIFLQNKNAKDTTILGTPDSEYHILSWPEVQDIIRRNRLDVFQRIPSDLRRYMEYNYNTRLKYGSVMEFIIKIKLGWEEPIVPAGGGVSPFDNSSDWSIKYNDWPYGIDKRVVHLVVWTKFPLPEDPNSPDGDLTDEGRRQIDDFVVQTFSSKIGKNNVSHTALLFQLSISETE